MIYFKRDIYKSLYEIQAQMLNANKMHFNTNGRKGVRHVCRNY